MSESAASSSWQPRAIQLDDHARLLELNNRHARELSWQSADAFATLLGRAWHARTCGDAAALLIAFDQDADYSNPNFAWCCARYRRFVYVDRIVVDAFARGQGAAERLYRELFERAATHGHHRILCEINAEPPNPASRAFHLKQGFVRIGEQALANGKTVEYFQHALSAIV